MSQILIDRELLQRILDVYFEIDAENRAYLGIQQKAQLTTNDQGAIHRYTALLEAKTAQELSGTQGLQTALRDQVQTQDAASFLCRLVPRFCSDRKPVSEPRTQPLRPT